MKWLHTFEDEPVLMYFELADDRSEIRKVEVVPNGEFGYTCGGEVKGTTQLSEKIIPIEQNIGSDPQFEPIVISAEEFRNIWDKAYSS